MRKNKKLLLIILIIGFICLLSNKVKAANAINKITMDVYINENGTAQITEVWQASLTTGTEMYKPYDNLGNSKITNFSVSDSSGKMYETLSVWNTNNSFENKAYKCGIIENANEGIELCWGISKYGITTYTLKYNITNFVAQYIDSQGIYFSFMPKNMNPSPEAVVITIRANNKFLESNSKIWAFGYPQGNIKFTNGAIVMNSNGILNSSNYMTALIQINNGTFTTKNKENRTFESVYNEAMSTVSDKNESSSSFTPLSVFLPLMTLPLTITFIVLFYIVMKKFISYGITQKCSLEFEGGNILPNEKDINYYRDIPCKKDMFRAYWVIYQYRIPIKSKASLIGAILLKWIKEGKINISKTKKGIFNFKDNNYAIDLTSINSGSNELETSLLRHLKDASGSNQILEAKEFEKWCKNKYMVLDNWFDQVINFQTSKIEKEGLIKNESTVQKKFGRQFTTIVSKVSSVMKEEAIQILGLKKFLLDYSMIADKQAIEVQIWEEYLIYATLLGIADKVQEQFSKIYPEFKEQSNLNTEEIIKYTDEFAYLGVASATKAKQKAEEKAQRARDSGEGGSSYSDGGSSAKGTSSGGGVR